MMNRLCNNILSAFMQMTTFILVLFVLTNCADDIELEDKRIPLALRVSLIDDNSRTFHLGEFLPDGARIGVRVADMNAVSYDAGVYNNVLYTASGTGANQKWTSDTQIMLSMTPANVYAYYPYGENIDITRMYIETDSQTDYMYATSVHGINYKNNEVNIEMNHVLTAVKLTLVYRGSLDSPKLSSVSFNSESCAKSAYMYGKDGSLSEFSGKNSLITLEGNDMPITIDENNTASVQYMVVPTGITDNVYFTCTINGKKYKMTAPMDNPLLPGCIHHFVATIDDSGCSLNRVTVENWTTASYTASSTVPTMGDKIKAVKADGSLVDVSIADNSCIAVALIVGDKQYWIEKKETANTTWQQTFTNVGATNTDYKLFYWGPYNSDIADIPSYTQVAPWSTSYSTYTLNRNWRNWGNDTAISDLDGRDNTNYLCSTTATDSYKVYPKAADLVKEFNKSDNNENFGYQDWYIPTVGELALIYMYMTDINKALTAIGGTQISSANYWSSCEYNSSYGYYVYMYSSYIYMNRAYKYQYYRVRLIRKNQ